MVLTELVEDVGRRGEVGPVELLPVRDDGHGIVGQALGHAVGHQLLAVVSTLSLRTMGDAQVGQPLEEAGKQLVVNRAVPYRRSLKPNPKMKLLKVAGGDDCR